MAIYGAFSFMLITAQRHWWKDILQLWRRCTVFILPFDYIPNYSASKQLNEAWMLWTDSVCSWSMPLYFEHPAALILFWCVWDIWWKRGVGESVKTVLITRVSSIRMISLCITWWVHDIMIWTRVCVCECAHVEKRQVLLWEQYSSSP